MNNTEIRNAAREANVKLWEIADVIGIADCAFSRKLRKELPEEEKNKILATIHDISASRKGEKQ